MSIYGQELLMFGTISCFQLMKIVWGSYFDFVGV